MGIKLKVPFVHQDQRHTCWYAAVCMVAFYFERGPRFGLPDRYEKDKGVSPSPHVSDGVLLAKAAGDVVRLAKAEGLQPVIGANRTWTEIGLTQLLKYYGPIWCAGKWFGGHRHIVVLTGVKDNHVIFNDPAEADPRKGEKKRKIDWFNTHLAKEASYCMLHGNWRLLQKRGFPESAVGTTFVSRLK